MKTLRDIQRRLLSIAVLVVSSYFLPTEAQAGNVYILDCAHCATVDDFKIFAGVTAAQRQQGGVYIIVGRNQPVTGHVRVVGQAATTCTPNGECQQYFRILSITSITSAGAPASSVEDLYNNDKELFGASRVEKLPRMTIDPDYASSFIGASDAEVISGIQRAFIQHNILPSSVATSTIVTFYFSDGTSAQFKKITKLGSAQWEWTGKAWDADGNPIERDGDPIANSNTPGSSGGAVGLSIPDRFGAHIIYSMTTSSKCLIQISITWNGRTDSFRYWTSCN